ncbi:immunoglobulin-like and fibronectin type III domain-containing protein 1 [Gouania willdenowi]|uniref:immunoglobulin-like and fibronectin type III domain-containing protein 1 n=1 Tax=Gouania willdenowi TaxID=441366 RepID=UPI0010559606|nr:immunoglobulin-like and fibronectin type III domain-containing protein 1 [Gouania willdenowi]
MLSSQEVLVAIKKTSKVLGVVIIQTVERLPLGNSTPDFTRKPMAVTVPEGKKATFKAMVCGTPVPTVTWERNKDNLDDPNKYRTRYDGRTREHILEIPSVKTEQADIYKCIATNIYGHAFCTVTLSVTEAHLKKDNQGGNK